LQTFEFVIGNIINYAKDDYNLQKKKSNILIIVWQGRIKRQQWFNSYWWWTNRGRHESPNITIPFQCKKKSHWKVNLSESAYPGPRDK